MRCHIERIYFRKFNRFFVYQVIESRRRSRFNFDRFFISCHCFSFCQIIEWNLDLQQYRVARERFSFFCFIDFREWTNVDNLKIRSKIEQTHFDIEKRKSSLNSTNKWIKSQNRKTRRDEKCRICVEIFEQKFWLKKTCRKMMKIVFQTIKFSCSFKKKYQFNVLNYVQ